MALAKENKNHLSRAQAVAKILHAFRECDDEVQQIIMRMGGIVNSKDADDQEREMAAETFFDALFPHYDNENQLGLDLIDDPEFKEMSKEAERIDEQEHVFAERVKALLQQKRMTQDDLAKATCVHQSAISMMLARRCRPQKRTVVKIAEALGVPEAAIWP